ncbi:MAG: choice-of-anchor D domain-containing protein [Planctomycetes bacterium]|nr:choice-of-anchor D domain-containing protein [Planctomycetota bacterium]
MRVLAMVLTLAALAGVATAQDYGDAPASYGAMSCMGCGAAYGAPWLGLTVSTDTQNPVSPSWTGDNDDGIVGVAHFNPWSNDNTLSVLLSSVDAHLVLFVDANDDGTFSADEVYKFNGEGQVPPGVHTFTGIRIHSTQAFSRNGTNKVAVRITAQENIGGWPITNPAGYFYFGEIEDWLIDIDPPSLAVGPEKLREATQGVPFNFNCNAVSGTPPYSWTLTAGSLPSGLSLTQNGDLFTFSGTPAVTGATGLADYPLTLRVEDSTAAVATRNLTLVVSPPPKTAPFADDFSTDQGWRLQGSWARVAATAATQNAYCVWGTKAEDPGQDASPTTDNMILSDTPAAEIPNFLPQPIYALSPKVDCTNLTTVELRFHRWLTYFGYDYVNIEVTNDGASWHPVWIPLDAGYSPLTLIGDVDAGWYERRYDISQWAAGKRVVQVRFALGPVNTSYKIGWGDIGSMGWNIDDFYIGAKPQTLTGASGLHLNSPHTFAFSGVDFPIGYAGYPHTWAMNISNAQAEDMQIEEVFIQCRISAQALATWMQPLAGITSGAVNVGTWSVSLPQTVGAGVSGFVLQGDFDCAQISTALALIPMYWEVRVRGTLLTSGQPFVMEDTCNYTHFYGPIPGLHVHEAAPGGQQGAEIDYAEAAASLRDFGTVIVGNPSGWVNIICDSTTSNSFNVSPPYLTGANAADFELYIPSPWSGTPQQGQNNTWFAVRFKPQSSGAKVANIEFGHTASNVASPFYFEVKGNAAVNAPVLEVRDGSLTGPRISNGSGAVGGLNFGGVALGFGPSAPLEIWLTNAGTQNLVLGTPTLTGAASGEFVLDTSAMAGLLVPGDSTSFSVTFNPITAPMAGTLHLATVQFAHNDTGTATPFTCTVSGDVPPPPPANMPIMLVTDNTASGPVVVSGAAATGYRRFGMQDVSAGPTTLVPVVISSQGGVDLALGTPTLVGANAHDFVLDLSQFNANLSFGQTCVILVGFDPVSKGLKQAEIAFVHNDAALPSPFSIAMQGVGQDPSGVVFTNTLLPAGKIGDAYMPYTLPVAGGTAPYTFALLSGSLPTGMTLASDGSVSGTPMGNHGVFLFQVRVTDSMGGTEERQCELPIAPPPGYVEKRAGQAGGCVAAANGSAWLAALLGLVLVARRRRKQA